MPNKIIESKIVIKSEDQYSRDFTKFFSLLDRGAQKVERFTRATLGLGAGAGAGGGAGVGQPYKNISRGAQRSEFAPPPGGAQMTAGYQRVLRELGVPGAGGPPPPQRPLPPGIVRLGPGEKWQPPPAGGGRGGGGGTGGGAPTNWQRFNRGTGAFIAGAGTLAAGAGGAMTPLIGGMLAGLGGQIGAMQTPGGGIPIVGEFLKAGQAATAAMMMAGGAALNVQWAAAQPAMAHYATHAGSYRVLGEQRAQAALDIARATGAFTPDEAMTYARQLNKFGGGAGFGTMSRMRFGGFEPDMMMPFFEQATKAGAAGGLKKNDYDYLAKVIAVSFSKQGLPSVEQALETMSGLMGNASNYLADIDKDQTAELAAMTHWMEGSGTAVLRGARGVQTMATLTNWTAKPGDAAKEMFIWQSLAKGRPGMSYSEMRKFRETPEATMAMVKEFAGMPREWGEMALAETTGMSYKHAEAVLHAADKYGADSDKVKDLIKNANPGDIDFKAGKTQADAYTSMMATMKATQLDTSKIFMEGAMKIEQGFLDMAKKVMELTNAGELTKKMGDLIITMANAVPSQEKFVSGVDKFCGGVNDFIDNLGIPGAGVLKFPKKEPRSTFKDATKPNS